jgi:hypothetical protein
LDICAPSSGGRNSITTTSNGGYTNLFGGTSSSAPLAAGVAALLLSVNPNLTWREVRTVLRQSADRIDPQNGRYDSTGHSHMYGYGRVNAFRALHAIPALNEAVRGSDVERRLPLLQEFAAFLTSRPGGKVIVDFLTDKKFRILELLKTDPSFRSDTVEILRAAADMYEGSERVFLDVSLYLGRWLAKTLLDESQVEKPEENELRTEKQTMQERSLVDTRNVLQPDTVAEINQLLQRLEEILHQTASERSVSGNSFPSNASSLPLEAFIEAASNGVLRAIEAREKQDGSERSLQRIGNLPIIVGLIFRPDTEIFSGTGALS